MLAAYRLNCAAHKYRWHRDPPPLCLLTNAAAAAGVFGEMSRAETEAALADLAASLGMGAGADAAMGPMSDMMTGGDMSGAYLFTCRPFAIDMDAFATSGRHWRQ